MKIFNIIVFSIAAFFLFVMVFAKWACSSPEYYEITGNDLQIVEIVKADYFNDTSYYSHQITVDSIHYFEFRKTKDIIDHHQYGLLITNQYEFCQISSGNLAYAIPQPGRSGSNQTVKSSRLMLVDNSNRNEKDISQALLPSDSINNYRWNDDLDFQDCKFICTSNELSSLKDSFNLSWFKHPLYSGEIFYLIPQSAILNCPKDFTLKLEIEYLDGTLQSSTFRGKKK